MRKLKYTFAALTLALSFVSCVSEEDQELPQLNNVIFNEDFQTAVTGTFDTTNWHNIAKTGTKIWFQNLYRENGYFEFSPFGSNEAVNEGWFITPQIDLNNANKKAMNFDVAQHHVIDATNNKLKVFISNDFTGDNFDSATWTEVSFTGPKIGSSNNYDFFKSGTINLAEFSGKINIAFVAIGGTSSVNAGAYMIDNIKVF